MTSQRVTFAENRPESSQMAHETTAPVHGEVDDWFERFLRVATDAELRERRIWVERDCRALDLSEGKWASKVSARRTELSEQLRRLSAAIAEREVQMSRNVTPKKGARVGQTRTKRDT